MRITPVLGGLVLSAFAGVGGVRAENGGPSPAPSPCAAGYTLDAARAAAIRALQGTSASTLCFGVTDTSVVSLDGIMFLDSRASNLALAARVAHLDAHLVNVERFDARKRAPQMSCADWVDSVMNLEGIAFATEVRTARRLKVSLPYLFAKDDPIDSGRIATFLKAHPDGSPGIEPLARGYAAQCERITIESPPR